MDKNPYGPLRFNKASIGRGIFVAIFIILFFLALSWLSDQQWFRGNTDDSTDSSSLQTEVPDTGELGSASNKTLTVNSKFVPKGGLFLTPSAQPSTAQAGQIIFNQATDTLQYYDGTKFVELAGGVTSIGGLTGAIVVGQGLSVANGVLTSTVSSSQTLTAGTGLMLDGTTLNNTGVVSIQGTADQVNVSSNSGSVTLSLPQSIALGSIPTFAGMNLSGNLTVSGNIVANQLVHTGGGQNITIDASGDEIVFTAGGRTFQFPTTGPASQTICTTGVTCVAGGGLAVELGPASAQTDVTGNPSIYIDNTGGSNLLQLQSSGVDRFVVNNLGNLTTRGDITHTNGSFSTTLEFENPTADVTLVIPALAAGTYEICTTDGNCPTGGDIFNNGQTGPVTVGTNNATDTVLETNNTARLTINGTTGAATFSGALTSTGLLTASAGISVNSETFTDLTGTGLQLSGGALQTTLGTSVDLVTEITGTLGVGNGGTGSTNAAGARTNLGAAASGANSDITSLSGLTTALSVVQGGTGATTFTQYGVIYGNNAGALQATASGSTGQCLIATTGAAPSWGACPGAGGIASLTLAGTSGTPQTITDGNTITIAAGTNVNTSAGATDTVTVSVVNNPTFSGLVTANGGLTVEAGDTFTFNGDAFTDLTGTNLVINTGALGVVNNPTFTGLVTANGGLTVEAGDTFTFNGDAFTDLTGTGLAVNTGVLGLTGQALTLHNLSCSNGQVIKHNGAALACGTDIDTDTNTTYSAGNGLQLASTTFSIDSPTCSAGQYLYWDGTAFICDTPTGTGATNAFTTISAPAGTNPVADSATDTLNLSNGSGITISGDSTTDTITIAATLGTSVDLAAEVTGTLPIANGGTGATDASGARTNLGATTVGSSIFTLTNPSAITFLRVNADNTVSALDAASFRSAIGAGTVTSVDVSGGTTGLSTSGGPITGSGTITLAGTLAVTNGGTGSTTTQGAINALSQLTTQGDLLYHNGTNSTRLARGTNGQCLTSNATTIVWASCPGAGGVASLTLAGTSGSSQTLTDGDTITIAAGTNVTTTAGATDTVTVSVVNNPTFSGLVTANAGLSATTGTFSSDVSLNGNTTIGDTSADLLTVNSVIQGTNALIFEGATADGFETTVAITDPTADRTITLPNASGTVAVSASGNIALSAAGDISFTGQLPIANGGTGASTSQGAINAISQLTTQGDLLYHNGTNSTRLARGSDGQCLTSNTTTIVWASCPGAGGISSLTLAGTSGTPQTISDGDTITIAAGTNVVTTGGATDTVTIAVVSNPTFTGLVTANGGLTVETGDTFTFNGDAFTDLTGTNLTINTGVLSVVSNPTFSGLITANGGLTVEAGDTFTFNGDAFTDLTGAGLTISGGALQTTLGTSIDLTSEVTGILPIANGGTNASSASGARTNLGAAASGANADITSTTALNTITPSAALTVGATSQSFTLQGTAGSTITATDTGNTTTVGFVTPTDDVTINFPALSTGTYELCTTSGNCLGGGSGGANTSLSNLSGVAINTSLLPGSSTIDLGSDASPFRSTYLSSSVIFEGSTADTNEITLSAVDPTADIVYRFADAAAGTYDICTTAGNCVGGGGGGAPNNAAYITVGNDGTLSGERAITAGTNLSGTDGGANSTYTLNVVNNPTFTGLITANGGLTVEAGDTFTFNGDAFTDLTGTGLTISSGSLQTTLGTSVDLTSEVTNTLPIANGGTNATTSQGAINNISQLTTNGDLLYHNGTNSTRLARGSDGQCLTSNTTTIIWASCPGSGGVASLTLAGTSGSSQTITDGDTITIAAGTNVTTTAGATDTVTIAVVNNPTFSGLVTANAGITSTTGTFSGDVASNANTTLGDAATDLLTINAVIQGANALVFEGTTADGFETTVAITDPTADRTITLPDASGTVAVSASGNIALSAAGNITFTGQLPVANGGTGASTSQGAINAISQLTTQGDLLYHDGTNSTRLARGSDGQCLTSNTTTIVWASCPGAGGISSLTLAGTSGTPQALSDGNTITIAAGTNISTTAGATDTVTVAVVSNPTFSGLITANGGLTVETGDTFTFNGDAFTDLTGTNLAISTGVLSVVDNPTFTGLVTANGGLTVETGDTFTFNGDAFTDLTGTGLTISGGALQTTLGTSVDLTSEVTGTLPIANGGTNATTSQGAINNISQLTTNGDLLYHNGTNSTRLARGSDTQCLLSNTTTITWGTCTGDGVGVTTVGALDGGTPNANGATISSNTIYLQSASGTNPGLVNTTTQTFAGDKTFSGATTVNNTLTVSGTAPDVLYGAAATINSTATSTTNAQGGLTVNSTISPSGAANLSHSGIIALATSSSANLNAGNSSGIYGFNGGGIYTGTSTIRVVGGGSVAYANLGSGTITHGRGIYVADGSNVGGGTITNGVGVLVQEQTAATNNVNLLIRDALTMPTGNWNIFSDSTYDSALAGNLSVGSTSAPTVALDVTGAGTFSGLVTANGGLTVEAGDTFTFNSDAFTDLTGTGLTISSGSLQTTLGTSVDLTSEVTGTLPIANGGTNATTSQGAINNISQLTTNGDLLYHNGTNSTRLARGSDGQCLTSNTTTIIWASCPGAGGLSGTLTDNITNAWDVQEGTNNYININTTNASENISFGNATTNPSFSFLGSGAFTVTGAAVFQGGISAPGSAVNSEAFGSGAIAANDGAVALGYLADAQGDLSVAIGREAVTGGNYGISIGGFSSADPSGVTVGMNASSGTDSVAIGNLSAANNYASIAIGSSASAHEDSIAIGLGATTSAAGQMVLGSDGWVVPISQYFFGASPTAANAASRDVVLNATGGSGTDIGGADLTLAGGRGTGTGAGGAIIFQTATAGSTGTSLNSLTTRMTIQGGGGVVIDSGSLTVGTSSQAGSLAISDGSSNTATIQAQATSGNYTYTIPTTTANDTFCLATLANCGGGGLSATLTDNTTNAWDIQEGTNNYININTTDSSEMIQFGNATTNPDYEFLGSGYVAVEGEFAAGVGSFNYVTISGGGAGSPASIGGDGSGAGLNIWGGGGGSVLRLSNAGGGDVLVGSPFAGQYQDITIGDGGGGTTEVSGGLLYLYGGTGVIFPDMSVDLTTYSNQDLTIAPHGTGDIVASVDDDTSLIVSGSRTNTGAHLNIDVTLGNDAGIDDIYGLYVDVTSAATGDADSIGGIWIGDVTSPDATVYEYGLGIGSGYDVNLIFGDTTTVVELLDTGSITLNDGTNTLLTITDMGTTADLSVTGDITVDDIIADEVDANWFVAAAGVGIGDGSSNYIDIISASQSLDYSVTIPTLSGNDTFCLQTLANCGGGLSASLTDNTANAWDVQEGSNNYININTTNASENVSFGNTTTNPTFNFLGTGSLTVSGATTINNTLAVTTSSTSTAQAISLTSTSGTQTAGLSITRSGVGGTTTSLLALTQSGGTATNGILFTGTIGTDITTASGRALTLSAGGTGDITMSLDDDTNLALSGTRTNTGAHQTIALTLGNDTAVDTVSALQVNVTSAATGDADILQGIDIANLTSANATVIERALQIGSGWDANLFFNDTTTQIQVANTGVITFEDDAGNDLLTVTDSGSTGTIAVNGVQTTTATITNTGAAQTINVTLGNDADFDTVIGLQVAVTGATTGDFDQLAGISINDLTTAGDSANAALVIGTNWGTDIFFANTAANIELLGSLAVRDTSGNALISITDAGTRGNLSVTGTGNNSEQFGASANASGDYSVALGNSASAERSGAIAIGYSSLVQSGTSDRGVAIGYDAYANDGGVALGSEAEAYGGFGASIALGNSSLAADANSIALGTNAVADGTNDFYIAIGNSSTAAGSGTNIALGHSSVSDGSGSIAIGQSADAGHTASIALGRGATTLADNQFVVGSDSYYVNAVVFGGGVISANAASRDVTIAATSGFGTDIGGADLTLSGGLSTGNAAGGSIIFNTTPAGTSGSSFNTPTARLTIDSTGASVFTGTVGYANGTADTNTAVCKNAAGQLAACTSSQRYKTDVQATEFGLDELRLLQPVSYTWTTNGKADLGFIAEQVAAVIPQAVTYDSNGEVSSFNPTTITAVLTSSVKQLDVQVQNHESRIAALEAALTGTLPSLHVSGASVFDGNVTFNGKLITGGALATITKGAQAGVDSTVSISGNDTAGEVTYVAGTGGAGEQVVVNFSSAYGAQPRVILTPSTPAAASIRYYVERTATQFKIHFIDTPVTGQTYKFDYIVIQ